mmetsp:Transcript_2919/g.7430  ORF Transcript_2919/g.7430 Transcript_2919/m.7430 type:complete len:202 (+) Transcript_2919:158-763(+)
MEVQGGRLCVHLQASHAPHFLLDRGGSRRLPGRHGPVPPAPPAHCRAGGGGQVRHQAPHLLRGELEDKRLPPDGCLEKDAEALPGDAHRAAGEARDARGRLQLGVPEKRKGVEGPWAPAQGDQGRVCQEGVGRHDGILPRRQPGGDDGKVWDARQLRPDAHDELRPAREALDVGVRRGVGREGPREAPRLLADDGAALLLA